MGAGRGEVGRREKEGGFASVGFCVDRSQIYLPAHRGRATEKVQLTGLVHVR